MSRRMRVVAVYVSFMAAVAVGPVIAGLVVAFV
jgi:hypothetical protein